MKYAYFPGCASKQLANEYDTATRLACKKLGIKLVDIPEFSCCGAGVVRETNKDFNTALNARNFAHSEKKNLDIMTICSTCVINLRKDLLELRDHPEKLEEANEYLKRFHLKCEAKLDVKHWLWALTEDYGLEKIKKLVKVPLTGLKVATYYGCHIARPSKIVGQHQESEKPDNFENFVKSLGAIPVDVEGKLDCCGFHIALVNKKAAANMSGKYLNNSFGKHVDLIVTNCPFCHSQMDLYQKESEKVMKKKFNIPIIHMSQLLCLALGIKPTEIGLQRHIVQLPKKLWKRFS
jgi:succinate dehydrogenase / fumarate reductase cytochrome b subunit